ncbi:ras-like protein family member 11A-like, partial [Gracilinanus agilis]|uniref:ras-like protein family member 11A-like n=1 Tax=Gracilinanus agilis TaxID=191870 RepID=UPI001CFD6A3A
PGLRRSRGRPGPGHQSRRRGREKRRRQLTSGSGKRPLPPRWSHSVPLPSFAALVVRFLTKRFIGDYEPNTGSLYSRQFTLDGEEISLQVQDTPYVALEENSEVIVCQEQVNRSIYWADGFVCVFSITDLDSYRIIRPLYQYIRKIHPNANIPLLLLGNKGDLLRARQVSSDEGEQLARELGGSYSEVSARENFDSVNDAFQQLCQLVGRIGGGGSGPSVGPGANANAGIGACSSVCVEKRRGLHLARPKSPNMQDLKRRLKQALSSKSRSATAPAPANNI